MLKHVVFMKFKPGVAEAAITDLQKSLQALPAIISEIRGFQCGRDIVRSERSFDFALTSDFDDLEAMQRYQVHPSHQAVVVKVKALSEAILAVDFNY